MLSAIGRTYRTYRHLKRYRQILAILIKYGFDDLVHFFKIDKFAEVGLQVLFQKKNQQVEKLTRAERLRIAIEELGPTFIKLGQILSVRPDLIPIDLVIELAKLQDEVPPFAYEEVCQIIQSEFGVSVEDLFLSFSRAPLASASIGQVHRAQLKTKQLVAVKIQRPNIWETIKIDLEIMLYIANVLERNVKDLSLHSPVKIVEEFAKAIEKELDYSVEAANMERITRQFAGDPFVYIPKIFYELSSKRVLTMEFVKGIKISEIDKFDAAGLDRKIVVERIANIVLKQIFQYGFFHADPHPGNIFVLSGNIICLLDFGVVGRVDRQTREDFVDLIESLVHRDEAAVTKVLLKITTHEKVPDIRLLEQDVSELMGQHLYKPIKDINTEKVLQQLLELASRHRLRTRPDFFLMSRATSAIEGVARLLDPDFDMIALSAPFIIRVKLSKFTPQRISSSILKFSANLLQFFQQYPNELPELLRMLKSESVGIKIDVQDTDTVLKQADKISNRIVAAMIVAALIIASAIIILAKVPPLLFGLPLFGILGFIVAMLLSLWILLLMSKSK